MKYLAIIGLLFLSGCCVVTSHDCFCDDSDEKVNIEGLEWLLSYQNQYYFVFEDSIGNIDSLKIERVSEEEECGGEECPKNCETEIVSLTSINEAKISFKIEANRFPRIDVNSFYPKDKYIYLSFDIDSEETHTFDSNFNINRSLDYISIDCEDDQNCLNYVIKGFKISKQEGLIEYTTTDNRKWIKVN